MISHYEESIHEYLKALAQNDMDENTSNQRHKQKERTVARIEELKSLMAEMEAAGVKEMSVTDPDSHLMGAANKGTDVAYNVQTVVDEKEHLIVTTEVSTSPADQTQLYTMADKTATELSVTEETPLTVLADKGYWRGEDLEKCERDPRINAIVAYPKEKGSEGFRKSDFI